MPSIQVKMISGLFKLIGVNRMLDKQGADFEKLLESYKEKQKKPLTTCYTVSKKGSTPKRAVLYLFGGGYILPPDPGEAFGKYPDLGHAGLVLLKPELFAEKIRRL